MRRRIHFHGPLKELGHDIVEVEAANVAEALYAISRVIPGLSETTLISRRRVAVLGVECVEDLARSDIEDIHLVPQFNGGKRGGFVQIAIGVVLVIASIYFPPLAGVSLGTIGAGATATTVTLGTVMFSVGASLVLGGVMQLLAPAPASDRARGDPEASKYLGAPQNTVRIGTRIPVGFGLDMAYGHFLSYNIDAKDVGL